MDIHDIDTDQIALRCQNENRQFARMGTSDPRYCFELFRRALAVQQNDALAHVRSVYHFQLLSWAHHHPYSAQLDEELEYFCEIAFENFYFNLSGDRFAGFTNLPAVLGYLRACIFTAISQYLRSQRTHPTLPLDDLVETLDVPDSSESVGAEALWQHICTLLPQPADQQLAYCRFVLAMKPQEIIQHYPGEWESEREVSVDLQRIRRTLRRDTTLRTWLGEDTIVTDTD